MTIPFDNTFVDLPDRMFSVLNPTAVQAPSLIAVNLDLASALGIDPGWMQSADAIQVFAGNVVPDGAAPIAQLYAGHQFGNWNPQLGDGRAILLGEVTGRDGIRRDIQLKGSGPTPYSRMGDGRAWLGPVLREYLVSEAMHAMGVPTTRALAAVASGEVVAREEPLPGAILTRVAQSHIRVGSFQIYAAREDLDALKTLADYTIARHYPDADGPAALLDAVVAAQAQLIAKWMALGFIHGVMNTDNVSIAGETIDYGPCAFMDAYNPAQKFSAIDQMGRYAYGNQPSIAVWNLAQFATSLIPLMPDQDQAVEDFTAAINSFADIYQAAWVQAFGAKLGLHTPTADDVTLIEDLLHLMAQDGADFTNVFANLGTDHAGDEFIDQDAFATWQVRWIARRNADFAGIMAQANPQVIPRNHQVQAVITAAVAGDLDPFHLLLDAVTAPFAPLDATRAPYAKAPADEERVTRTFCGT